MRKKTLLFLSSTTLVVLMVALPVSGELFSERIGKIPDDWFRLPEDNPSYGMRIDSSENDVETKRRLAPVVGKIFSATSEAIEKVPAPSSSFHTEDTYPRDWTPWHLEYFTTDLSITLEGLLGILSISGSPTVSAVWKRRSSLSSLRNFSMPGETANGNFVVEMAGNSNAERISQEIEPAIQAVSTSGKVQDIDTLRRNLTYAAYQFHGLISVLQDQADTEWWPSQFRIEFEVDALGYIHFGVIGGDLKLSFQWNRLKQSSGTAPSNTAAVIQPVADEFLKYQQNLKNIVRFMEANLGKVAQEFSGQSVFVPDFFWVEIGFTGSGDIGIAKGTGSATGSLYFSRRISKGRTDEKYKAFDEADNKILIIENSPSQSHLDFANQNGINYHWIPVNSRFMSRRVGYRLDSARWQNSIRKSIKIASFFGREGNRWIQGDWGIYEIITYFNLSITGGIGVIGFGETGTVGIGLRNQSYLQ